MKVIEAAFEGGKFDLGEYPSLVLVDTGAPVSLPVERAGDPPRFGPPPALLLRLVGAPADGADCVVYVHAGAGGVTVTPEQGTIRDGVRELESVGVGHGALCLVYTKKLGWLKR